MPVNSFSQACAYIVRCKIVKTIILHGADNEARLSKSYFARHAGARRIARRSGRADAFFRLCGLAERSPLGK